MMISILMLLLSMKLLQRGCCSYCLALVRGSIFFIRWITEQLYIIEHWPCVLTCVLFRVAMCALGLRGRLHSTS
jgi:hypothetical protein